MKKPCDQDKVTLFWSEELEHDESQLMASHIKECHSCREFLQGLQRVESQIQKIPIPGAVHDFAGDAVDVAYKQKEYTFVWNDRLLLAIAAGIICILGMGLLWSLKWRQLDHTSDVVSYKRTVIPIAPRSKITSFSFVKKPEDQLVSDKIEDLKYEITALRKGQYKTFMIIENKDDAGFQGHMRIWKLRRRARALRASI